MHYDNTDSNKVIIVYSKNQEGYSNLMSQLIAENFKDKAYEVVEWDEAHWKNNKAQMLTSQKVIFIGKAGAHVHLGINWRFDMFSMKYGWLGSRCLLNVDLLKEKDIKDFKEYTQQHVGEAEASLKDVGKAAGAGARAIAVGAAKFTELMDGIKPIFVTLLFPPSKIGKLIRRNKLKKYQYPLLVKVFVTEGGFTEFMEG